MANVKISDLPVESAPTPDDLLVVVDSGAGETRQVTLADFLTNISGSDNSTILNVQSDSNPNILSVSGSGFIGIGTAAPIDRVDVVGGIRLGTNRTDNTSKTARIIMPEYDVDEEGFILVHGNVSATNNFADIGGGTTTHNVATRIRFFTAAAVGTLGSGNERLRVIDSLFAVNPTQDDYDFQVSGDNEVSLLYVDADVDRVGVGIAAPEGRFHVLEDVNGAAQMFLENPNAGAGALSALHIGEDVSNSEGVSFQYLNSGFPTTGLQTANQAKVVAFSNATAGWLWQSLGSGPFIFTIGASTAVETERFRIADTEVVVNENGEADVSFRVESDTQTHAFFVTGSTGRVGIGTDSPTSPLHVSGSSEVFRADSYAPAGVQVATFIKRTASGATSGAGVFLLSDDGAAQASGDELGNIRFGGQNAPSTPGTGAFIRAHASSLWTVSNSETHLTFWTSDNGSLIPTEKVRIASDGNVGIGTDTPLTALHVAQSTGTDAGILVQHTAGGAASLNLRAGTGPVASHIGVAHSVNSLASGTSLGDLVIDSNTSGSIAFATNNDVRMYLSGSNLGIGTSAPARRLDVSSSIAVGGASGGDAGSIAFRRGSDGALCAGVYYTSGSSDIFAISNCNGHMRVAADNVDPTNTVSLWTGGSNRLHVSNAGDVGIGTDTPSTKMEVREDQNAATALRVRNANTGTGTEAQIQVTNSASSAYFRVFGTGFTSSGLDIANTANFTIDSTLDGLYFYTPLGGSRIVWGTANIERFRVEDSEAIFNAPNLDVDFRVGSLAGSGSFFVQGSTGNVGIGTTAPLDVLSVTGSTLSSGQAVILATATLNTAAAVQRGSVINITGAGSSATQASAQAVNLLAGYTGAGTTSAVHGVNSSAGTGTSFAGGAANYGMVGAANGATAGVNFGYYGFAEGSTTANVAVFGLASTQADNRTNVGVLGQALNSGGTGRVQTGGYFHLGSSPTFVNAALIADNDDETAPIFLGRDNGSTVFIIEDGGSVGIGETVPYGSLHITRTALTSAAASSDSSIVLEHNGTNYIQFLGFATDVQGILFGDTAAAARGRVQYNHSDDSMEIWANSLRALHIDNACNIGIGNTSPSAKLHVSGAMGSDIVTFGEQSGSIATDGLDGNVFEMTLSGNATLDNLTNLVAGFTYMWIVTQELTGSRTLAYGGDFKFPGGTAPTLSTATGSVDILSAVYDGTNLYATFQSDFS